MNVLTSHHAQVMIYYICSACPQHLQYTVCLPTVLTPYRVSRPSLFIKLTARGTYFDSFSTTVCVRERGYSIYVRESRLMQHARVHTYNTMSTLPNWFIIILTVYFLNGPLFFSYYGGIFASVCWIPCFTTCTLFF